MFGGLADDLLEAVSRSPKGSSTYFLRVLVGTDLPMNYGAAPSGTGTLQLSRELGESIREPSNGINAWLHGLFVSVELPSAFR